MQEDKIILILQELRKVRADLHEIKKDLKREEKIDDEQYETMKKTVKEMRGQIREFETNWKAELHKDSEYQKLVELKVGKDEEAANLIAEMYHLVKQLPPKAWETNMDTEDGPVRVQVMPEMTVYLNGKEEKKRA